VALESIQKQSAALSASVSDLDSKYLELGSAVTPDSLATYGLVQGKVSAYIPRTAPTASLNTLAARGHEL
jgi:hypothetical protein